jgi:hypothetical protein
MNIGEAQGEVDLRMITSLSMTSISRLAASSFPLSSLRTLRLSEDLSSLNDVPHHELGQEGLSHH